MRPRDVERLIALGAFAGIAAPALVLGVRFAVEGVGPDPIKTLIHTSGDWALRFLLASLAVTPLRRVTGWRGLAPLRRRFGLASFAYALAHVLCWAILDLGLDPAALAEDLGERPFVMAGMSAFAVLAALAATSTRSAMRRLGSRWVVLHRAVYAAAGIAVVHHFWSLRADDRPAWIHAAILALLLGLRLAWRLRRPVAATT